MSSKIGLILSMIFVAFTFLFGADLLTLQGAFTVVQNKANDIAYELEYYSCFDQEMHSYLESKYEVTITPICGFPSNTIGDSVEFSVSYKVEGLLFMPNSYTLTASRTAILGYYGLH